MSTINLGTMVWGIKADTKGYSASMKQVESIQRQVREKERSSQFEQIEEARKVNKIRVEFEAQREQYLKARRKLSETASREEIAQVEKIRKAYVKLGEAYDSATDKLARNIRRNRNQLKGLNQELELAKKTAGGLGGGFGKLGGLNLGAIKGAVGIITAVGVASAATFKKLVDDLDELGKRARDIGITASQLQELQHQAKLAGISTSELDVSMRSFNRNVSLAAMGTGEARKALDSMGISLTKANGEAKTQRELLQEVATYFAKNAGEAENAGRAARIFGERGAEMLRIFEQGEDSVEKVFNAKGIDEAVKSAEQFKDSLEDLRQSVMPTIYKYAGALAEQLVKTFDPERYFKGIASEGINNINYISAETKKKLIELEAQILQAEDELKDISEYINPFERKTAIIDLDMLKRQRRELQEFAAKEAVENSEKEKIRKELLNYQNNVLKKINEANDRFFTTTRKTKELEEQREIVIEKLKVAKEELNNLDKRSVEYANAYAAAAKLKGEYIKINTRLAKKEADEQEKAEKKLAKIELQRQQKRVAEVKKQIDTKKNQQESRSDFELQTKIQILQAQGKTREAEALKFAKARNELMEKYGYSLKQAEQVQRTLNELEKTKGKEANTYSDEMKERAKKVLARGEGGSVGKQTLADAQAVLDGKTPEGGFKTAMFQKLDEDSKKDAKKKSKTATLKGGDFGLKGGQFALKELNVDAKASKENLDNEAQTIEEKNSQSLDSLVQGMESLNETIKALKRTVDGIAIKKGAA